MDIMKYGSDCEVIEPEPLKTKVVAEFKSGLARYRRQVRDLEGSAIEPRCVQHKRIENNPGAHS